MFNRAQQAMRQSEAAVDDVSRAAEGAAALPPMRPPSPAQRGPLPVLLRSEDATVPDVSPAPGAAAAAPPVTQVTPMSCVGLGMPELPPPPRTRPVPAKTSKPEPSKPAAAGLGLPGLPPPRAARTRRRKPAASREAPVAPVAQPSRPAWALCLTDAEYDDFAGVVAADVALLAEGAAEDSTALPMTYVAGWGAE